MQISMNKRTLLRESRLKYCILQKFKFKNFHLSLQTHITDYVTRKRIIVFVWQLYREIYLHLKGVVTFAQCQQSRILKNFLLYQTIEFREKISKTSLMHMKFFLHISFYHIRRVFRLHDI